MTAKNKGGRPPGKNVVKITTTITKAAHDIFTGLQPKGGETISKLLIENFNPIVKDGKFSEPTGTDS